MSGGHRLVKALQIAQFWLIDEPSLLKISGGFGSPGLS